MAVYVWNVVVVTVFSVCCAAAVWHAAVLFERRFRRR